MVALAALAIIVGLCEAQSTAPRPAFEVVSIKPVPGGIFETKLTRSGGRITWTADFWYLISYAYHLPANSISGAIPAEDPVFRVDARTDPAATEAEVRLMFQSMLADRFKLTTHLVQKDADGYALSIAKGGSKLKEASPDDEPAALPEWSRTASVTGSEGRIWAVVPGLGATAVTGRRVSMSQLAEELHLHLGLMVWDHTGLTGKYYFGFQYSGGTNSDTDAPSLATALRESLGLKLEKEKGAVETLVVDHIEKEPTEN